METLTVKLPGEHDFYTQEAYKALRTNIQLCGRSIKVVMFTSCHESEGKSTITLHVAKSFAELGKRVLFIDADMRKSVLATRNMSITPPQGLSEVLSGMCSLREVLFGVADSTMHMLFSGQYPPNPVELLNSKSFKTLIEESRNYYDYIFIDTPPLGRVIDAAEVATECDGAILILGSPKIRQKEAQDVVELLKKTNCKILGAVRNSGAKEDKYQRA